MAAIGSATGAGNEQMLALIKQMQASQGNQGGKSSDIGEVLANAMMAASEQGGSTDPAAMSSAASKAGLGAKLDVSA